MLKKILKLTFPALLAIGALLAALSIAGVLPYKLYAVRTGSMTPTYPPKSAVLVYVGHYHTGQPVTYRKGNMLITHRLLAINSNGTINTKGDANPTMDPWHEKTSAIVGGVIAASPMAGYWLVYLKNPLGLASLADLVIIIWLIWDLAGVTGHKRQRATTPQFASEEMQPLAGRSDSYSRALSARPTLVIDGLSLAYTSGSSSPATSSRLSSVPT